MCIVPNLKQIPRVSSDCCYVGNPESEVDRSILKQFGLGISIVLKLTKRIKQTRSLSLSWSVFWLISSTSSSQKKIFFAAIHLSYIKSRKWILYRINHAVDLWWTLGWRTDKTERNYQLDGMNFRIEPAESLVKRNPTILLGKRFLLSCDTENSPKILKKRKWWDHQGLFNYKPWIQKKCKSGLSHYKCTNCNINQTIYVYQETEIVLKSFIQTIKLNLWKKCILRPICTA